jgi:hypothetical protein
MPNTRRTGVFKTTILSITPGAQSGRNPTYKVVVVVNGTRHVVSVGISQRYPGAYISEGGFDDAFPWAGGAVRAIGMWADRVHKGEVVHFPVELVI